MPPYAEVIGDPVVHSKSPDLHRFWLEALAINADYRQTRVRQSELRDYFAERRRDENWRGCNLTAPLKEAALPLLDRLSETARAIGSVNIVRSDKGLLTGDNSDVDGIKAALPAGVVERRTVAIIGNGGAARAAVHYVVKHGASRVRLLVRNPSRSVAMTCGDCRISIRPLGHPDCLTRSPVIINASPLGMAHAPTPDHLLQALAHRGSGFLFDMVYEPFETDLLRIAARTGLRTADGLTMLIGQADRAFRTFFGHAPPRFRDEELRQTLVGRQHRRPIVLVGMPGSGKSTIGPALAARLGLDFIDSDQEIERRLGTSIAHVFETHGEHYFRRIERNMVRKLIVRRHGVIALGGGAFSHQPTREIIKQYCRSVWLKVPLDILIGRLKNDGVRPLLAEIDLAKSLHSIGDQRSVHYRQADIHVNNIHLVDTLDCLHRELAFYCLRSSE